MTIIIDQQVTSNFSLNRDDIIRAALEELGEVAEGEPITPDRLTACALRLNSWVKQLMAGGAKLWAMQEATLFLTKGVANYALGASGDHCTNEYVQTTLSAAASSGATTISLTSLVGLDESDNIGIVLDDGSIYWTTIEGAPDSPTTIGSGLSGAASAGNVVFAYVNKINRPQRIDGESAYWRSAARQDTPIKIIARNEYAQLSNKSSRGKIVQAFYNPQLGNGILSVWPAPDNATDVLRFWYERILEDFDTSDDTPDFAIEWGEALILGLAAKMAPSAGLTLQERAYHDAKADQALFIAMNYDHESTSMFCQPDIR